MTILEGVNVDVICPFPAKELTAAAQWMRIYKTLIFDDSGPQTNEEIERDLRYVCGREDVKSFGIIDKNNLTQSKTNDTPLVGIFVFEQMTPYHGYAHVASNRRAWGEKIAQPALTEQAGRLCAKWVFEQDEKLQRISMACMAANKGARSIATRIGFHKDGYFKAMKCVNGMPVDVMHFGLLRNEV